MHPSIIGCLNRRFVSTYYDVHPGPGHDAEGAAFAAAVAARAGQPLRYGAIVTPEGTLVAAFGFARDEVVAALRTALEAHPDLARFTADEQAILAAAVAQPTDVAAQLRAAALECDLLDHAAARRRLAALRERDLDPASRSIVAAAHAHAGVLDLGERDVAALRAQLRELTDVAPEWRDDVVADLVALDVELGKADFFGGWRLRDGVDGEAHRQAIVAELARDPRSDRAGELRFLLGLCHLAAGDRDAADQVFAAHGKELPDDRHALLSRLQHRNYAFHPTERPPEGGNLADPALATRLRQLMGENANVQIRTADGRVLTGEEARAFLEGRLPAPAAPESPAKTPGEPQPVTPEAPPPARDNFRLPESMKPSAAGVLPPVEVIGTGAVPLLLVPGLGFDASTAFGAFARRTADRYTSHLIDLPGFGAVPPWPAPAVADDFHENTWTSAAVQAICERARSLDRPILIGHFLGGAEIALQAALLHPERFAAVVVVTMEPARAFTSRAEPQSLVERRQTVAERWQPFFKTVTPERWQRGMYPASFYCRDDALAAALWQETVAVPVEIMVRWFLEYQSSDSSLRVGDLKVPLLAMEPSGRPARWWQSWNGIAERFPQAPMTVQPWKNRDSRAFPMLDAPEWFDARLDEFVAQQRRPR